MPRLRSLAALAIATLALAACAQESAPDPAPSASATAAPSATPSTEPEPSAAPYEAPDEVVGALARADFAVVDGIPQTSSEAIAPMVADQPIVIEGQCTGGTSMDFLLERAVGSDLDERLLVEGTIDCDAPRGADGFSYSLPYDGVVQLTIAVDDDVTDAWAVVRTA